MKRFLFVCAMVLVTVSMMAIPAKRGQWKTLVLPNGTQVQAELHGDEFLSYWQSSDGNKYILDEGQYTLLDIQLLEKSIQRRAIANKRRAARRVPIGDEHTPYIGKKKGLILLVEFNNKSFATGHNKAFYDEIANADDLSLFRKRLGFVGSVKKYFLDQSRGQFELDFDVFGPYKLPYDYAYYGAHSGSSNDSRPGRMIATACELADKDVNFDDYDWDGDGYVEQLYVLYAGKGEADGGDENTIWPHEWHLTSSDYGRSFPVDHVVVDTYACGNELGTTNTGNNRVEGIGTICHEFSHCLGLPDMYDTGGNNYGMFTWDLMDQGSYNGLSYVPSTLTSYERMYAGWLDPIELKEPTTVKGMRPLSEDGQTFIIYNDANKDEYYLLENRQLTEWDAKQYGNGLLVLHVDYDPKVWRFNVVNNTSVTGRYYDNEGNLFSNDHQRCTIIHADNDDQYLVASLKGDPFPYNDVNALTNETTPAASLYNENTDGTHFMNKPITNIIQHEDGTISFDFMGGSATNVIDAIERVVTKETEDDQPRVYDTIGRVVSTSLSSPIGKGIFIVKQNGKTRKVVCP